MGTVSFDFTDDVVLVTGAARGLGLAMSRRFAAAGATVVMVDRDAEELAAAAGAAGGVAVPADVTDTASVTSAVERAHEIGGGRIDVLVNNAGILRDRTVWKLTDDDWQTVQDVHLGGTFRFTRACVPLFRERGYGRIVNVTSYTGLRGNVGQANYAAAKAGIIGFTKTTAKELARFGITVNAVSPNAETRMVSSIPEAHKAELAAQIPLGYFADPDEISPAVAFLASRDAGYVTGIVMPVDGGISI